MSFRRILQDARVNCCPQLKNRENKSASCTGSQSESSCMSIVQPACQSLQHCSRRSRRPPLLLQQQQAQQLEQGLLQQAQTLLVLTEQ
jgi:hypothetical protein